jgi:serine/threonine protein kinase
MVGKTLAHYEIVEKIGEGGMGEVYRARDERLDRDVAIKLLPEGWASDSRRVRRFEREAKVLAALKHPNIADVYGFHEESALHFIVMELLEGGCLASSVTEEGLPLDQLLEIGIPLADAIAFAHDRGVIHRDLKPSNVMLDGSGRIRVLDFGVAGFLQSESDNDRDVTVEGLTTEGEVVGTLAYMAPEQLEGQGVDGRADVFSLGVVLYELATGLKPFRADSTAGVASAILRDDPAPLREVRPDLPADLDRLIRRCLNKSAERRMQTARDVRNELEELRVGIRTDEPSQSGLIQEDSLSLAEREMVITTEHVRRLSMQIPRMVGDSITYIDNERDSDVLVVYLHGLGGDQSEFEEALRQTPFRAVALSLYGFGPKARMRPPLPYADHNLLVTFLIEEVVQRLRPRTRVLVGHSSGADQMLRIVVSEEGNRIRPDGLILLGPETKPGSGFVSGPFSRMTDDPADILEAIRAVSTVAEDLDGWLTLHDYLVRAFGKFGMEIKGLRKFAQDVIAAYNEDEFFEFFRTATERVPHIRCVFSSDDRTAADHALDQHIANNALGDRYSEEMFVMESAGHVELRRASVLLPYVEEIVRRTV